ncbi:hypothetical protein ABW20_dc0106294 [Dactylellina cionopaga]|nr:hypothetical protein ABW20_dc0106294 [Dactylellina cionopaga]
MTTYDISGLTAVLSGGTKNGNSLLQDWDILVAYDEFALNNLLGEQGAATKALQSVPEFTVTNTDDWGNTVTYDYVLELSNPTLKFLPETTKGDFLQISFGLTGTISRNGSLRTIPASYDINMIVTAPLVSAEGTISEAGAFQADPSTVQNSTGIVMTPSGKQNMVCICLQKNSLESITFTSDQSDGQLFIGDGTTLNPAINDLATHLDGAASLSFYLSGVQSSPTPQASNTDSMQLQPVCFMFSLVAADDTKTGGALCMYICVEGGVSPKNQGGQRTGLGLMDPNYMKPLYPIPSGRNAAIYFNHFLIMDTIFLPSFTQAGLKNVQVLAFDATKGTHLTYVLPSNPGVLQGENITLSSDAYGNSDAIEINSIGFDPVDFQSNIYIKAGISTDSPNDTALITFTNTSPTYQASWTENKAVYTGGEIVHETYSGIVDVSMALGGQSRWQQEATTTTPEILTSFDAAYTMTQTPVSGDTSIWQNILGQYWSNQLPPQYSAVPPSPPTITMSFPQLGYFLATNLLLPGSNVFTPDPAITDANNQIGGIAIPWDMVITGSIVANLKSEAPVAAKACKTFTALSRPQPLPHIHSPLLGSHEISHPQPQITAPIADPNASLEDRFLSDLSAYNNSNTFIGDMWSAVKGDDLDSITAQLDQVLAKRGYQDLNVDSLSNMVGYSYDSNMAFMLAGNGQASPKAFKAMDGDAPTFVFDLGVYSGVYSIDGQADTVQLLLSPDTHAITYAGTTVVPTITSDNNTQSPQYTVSWSSGTADNKDLVNYAIQFKAVQVANSGNFQQSFVGTQTPSESITSTPTPFSGTKLATTPPFDLRICAGTYVVSAPSDMKDSILYVARADGSIQWQGDTFQPHLTVDTQSGATNVSWTDSDGAAYTVNFYNADGNQYFSGYITSNDLKNEFRGQLKQDGTDPGIKDAISAWGQLSQGTAIIDILMSTFTVGTIIFAIIKFSQRKARKEKENNKAQQRDEQLVGLTVDAIKSRDESIHSSYVEALTEKMNRDNASWKKIGSMAFDDGAKDIIRDKLAEIYQNHPDAIDKNGIVNPNDDTIWGDLHAELREYVQEKVDLYGKDNMNPISDTWRDLLNKQAYSADDIADLTKDVVGPRVDAIVSNLVGTNLKDKTWAQARVNEIAMNTINSKYTNIADRALNRVNRLQNIVNTYPDDITTDGNRITAIDKALGNNPTNDKKAELESEREVLENNIQTKQSALDDANANLQPAKDRETRNRQIAEDAGDNSNAEVRDGNNALKEAFKL